MNVYCYWIFIVIEIIIFQIIKLDSSKNINNIYIEWSWKISLKPTSESISDNSSKNKRGITCDHMTVFLKQPCCNFMSHDTKYVDRLSTYAGIPFLSTYVDSNQTTFLRSIRRHAKRQRWSGQSDDVFWPWSDAIFVVVENNNFGS